MPHLSSRLRRPDLLHVCFIHLADVDLPALAPLQQCLSSAERQRLARLQREADQRRFVLAHAAIRHAIGQTLGLNPKDVPFENSAYGKPALAPAYAGLHFNLSHAGDWVALAWTRLAPIGIDVEQAISWFADLLPECAQAAEQAELQASQQPDQAFLRLWTCKEAVLKAHGSGLSIPMKQVTLQTAKTDGWMTATLAQDATPYLVQTLSVDAQHLGAVALAGPEHGLQPGCGMPVLERSMLDASALLNPDFTWSLT